MKTQELIEEFEDYSKRFSMLENVQMASVMLNAKWQLVFANSHFLEITGYQKEEVINSDWVDVFIPQELQVKTRNTYELILNGIVEVSPYLESSIITKKGKRIIIGWNNLAMKDTDGKIVGISSVGENLCVHKGGNHYHKNDLACATHDGPHEHDQTCVLLKNYEKTNEDPAVMENLVMIKVLKDLALDRGHVQLAVHTVTKEKVAVKCMRKDLMKPEEIERARREIEIMQQLTKLNNPHIIKLIGAEETATHFNLVVEYLSGGELVAMILKNKGLSEAHAHRFFNQLLSAIETCHKHSIVHRDIKLQNILLDANNNIKLIDFGLSNFVENDSFRNTFCGTPAYASPEILMGTKYRGPEVDMWSLGVVLYCMLTAEFPFTTINDILVGNFKDPQGISKECLELLHSLLTVKKELRCTLAQVLEHPWTTKCEQEFPKEECCEDCDDDGPIVKRRRTLQDADLGPSKSCTELHDAS